MKKKLYAAAISTAVAASLLTAGNVMAENIITPSITAAQIGLGSTCGKTGNFTFTFDEGTELTVGDKFEMALPLSATQEATLCKGLNLVINDNGNVIIDGTTVTGAATTISADPTGGPVYGVTTAGVAPQTVANIGFRITGSATGQVVTLEVIGTADTLLKVAPGETLSIDFLNELNYSPGAGLSRVWAIGPDSNDTVDSEYSVVASPSANAMCIDVSQWNETVVTISLDANDTKYSYSDTGPRIASIGGDNSYSMRQCAKGDYAAGTIDIWEETQGGATCDSVTNSSTSEPYCPGTHFNNYFVVDAANGWAADNYTVEMEIVVNGETGDNGVYFKDTENTVVEVLDDACDTPGQIGATLLPAATNTFYLQTGAEAAPTDDCETIDDEAKAVKLVTSDVVISTANAGAEGMYIPIPTLLYNSVVDGDDVQVRIKINKAPCTDVITEDWNIGTFVDSCSVAATAETIQFPYFVVPNDGGWWNGLAVTNYSMEAGMLQLMIYEEDGDQGTAEVEIGANSMFVDTLYSMIFTKELFTQTAGEGTLGDSRSYVVVRAEGIDIDGFGMISNSPTGQSMGYLTKDNFHLNHTPDVD